jgi:hypothetical protein
MIVGYLAQLTLKIRGGLNAPDLFDNRAGIILCHND